MADSTKGIYKSSVCPQQIALNQPENTIYPIAVYYKCPCCNKKHPFSFSSRYIIDTPKKREQFELFCRGNNIPIVPLSE